MYSLKILSTQWSGPFESLHDNFHHQGYEGVDKVPYLQVGFNQLVGHNIIIMTIDESRHTVSGALVLHCDPNESLNCTGCKNWISSIGVHPEYRGCGLSKVLVREFFKLCDEHGIHGIEQSSYTEMGNERVRHIFEEYADKYPQVNFVDVLNIEESY